MVQGNHKILTGKNVDSIKRMEVSAAQENFVNKISDYAGARYDTLKKEGKLEKIKVFADKLLIKVTQGVSALYIPGGMDAKGIKRIEVFKLSETLKERFPDIPEGAEVEINPRILQFGNGPFLEWIDSEGHYIIYKINFDHVECIIG